MIYELIKHTISTIDWCVEKRCVERSSSLDYIKEAKKTLEQNNPNAKYTIESKEEKSSPYGDWRDVYQ